MGSFQTFDSSKKRFTVKCTEKLHWQRRGIISSTKLRKKNVRISEISCNSNIIKLRFHGIISFNGTNSYDFTEKQKLEIIKNGAKYAYAMHIDTLFQLPRKKVIF